MIQDLEIEENYVKRGIKDVVFHDAFASNENLPKIYQALFPNRKVPDKFITTSLISRLFNQKVNDLSFLCGDEMIFIEAVSSWKRKDLIRFGEYVLRVFFERDTITEDFNPFNKEISIIILCTDQDHNPKAEQNIYDALNIVYNNQRFFSNWKVTVISRQNGNVPKGSIIEEYFQFCELERQIRKTCGSSREAARKLVKVCLRKNIFRTFFENNEGEAMRVLKELYDQERITNELMRESRQEGIEIGREEGIEIGREEGIEIGREEATIQTQDKDRASVIRMLISKLGLSSDEALKLADEAISIE